MHVPPLPPPHDNLNCHLDFIKDKDHATLDSPPLLLPLGRFILFPALIATFLQFCSLRSHYWEP